MPKPRVSNIIQTIKTGGARDLTIRLSDPLTGQVEEVVINNERDAVLARKHMPHLYLVSWVGNSFHKDAENRPMLRCKSSR